MTSSMEETTMTTPPNSKRNIHGSAIRSASALVAIALGVACSSTTTSTAVSGPTKACNDTADAVAKAAQRCGSDYQSNYNAFVNAVGTCEKIVQIRDETSLRSTCLPSLSTISCTDLMAGNLDASCKGQLLKSMSVETPATPVVGAGSGDVTRAELFVGYESP
jgi:hypothetical protein